MLSPLALHRHLNNFHGIVAKNIDYLHRDFAPSGQALHEGFSVPASGPFWCGTIATHFQRHGRQLGL